LAHDSTVYIWSGLTIQPNVNTLFDGLFVVEADMNRVFGKTLVIELHGIILGQHQRSTPQVDEPIAELLKKS